ncbi:hypothetical protein [Terrimonas pollutisoli]|uniref:hypothetical protein n=1 Tax=Terrimonas pollutisoli TaxID=3034147 RepID=UPI0023EB8F61|nr:hypothetical protein [Terrimonas sp. H1YJ31]
MEHSIITQSFSPNGDEKLDELQQSLESIEQKLDNEVLSKQKTIDRQEQEINHLHLLIEGKDKTILELTEKLSECMHNAEGNRQLINKLLNDIDRINQDIEWYKRTYEKRSLTGTIMQKLFRKNN